MNILFPLMLWSYLSLLQYQRERDNPLIYLSLIKQLVDKERKKSGTTWSFHFNKTMDNSYYDQEWNLIPKYDVVQDYIHVTKKQGLELLESMNKALYIQKDIGWGKGKVIRKTDVL